MARETSKRLPVAIVGCGLTGLTLAQRLREARVPLCLFDKSGDIGGRLATRDRPEGQWNHGAPWLDAAPADSRAPAGEPTGARAAFDHWLHQHAAGCRRAGRLTGSPRMRDLLRPLADARALRLRHAIDRLTGRPGAWLLHDDDGRTHGPFARVLLTQPAPQIRALLDRSGLDALAELDAVRMAPRWTLLLRLHELPGDRSRALQLAGSPVDDSGWTLLPGLAASTPEPAGTLTLVAHAPVTRSRELLDSSSRQATERLRPALHANLSAAGFDPEHLIDVQAHRWRFALTEQPLGAPCLWSPTLALGAAGDWCLGPRANDAWRSAQALADRLLADEEPDAATAWPAFDELDADRALIADLRSDHAGETGAVWIYRGVLRFTRDPLLREFAAEHLATEQRHLDRFDGWLPRRHHSRLLPLWRLAGFALGALPLLGGRRWLFATIDAVERFVVEHYDDQIDRLLQGTEPQRRLARALTAFRDDEDGHRQDAAGRTKAPPTPALRLWCRLVGAGSRHAVAVARRL